MSAGRVRTTFFPKAHACRRSGFRIPIRAARSMRRTSISQPRSRARRSASWPAFTGTCANRARRAHDPEKWVPVFGQDHAPTKSFVMARISYVSLGCPKALVDSERILTTLRAEGYELSREHAGADLVIVNTCGFLDSAQEESLGAIGTALAENGKVVVTGCMGAEPEKITEKFPNVFAVTGPQQYESVVEAVHRAAPPAHDPFLDLVPPEGIKLTPRHYAYLKISEGCNNRCSFCIIPKLRGDLVSRPAADVLREAERLVKAGVKELLVISQDTSAYGVDIKYASSQWRDREVRARFLDLAGRARGPGAWGGCG